MSSGVMRQGFTQQGVAQVGQNFLVNGANSRRTRACAARYSVNVLGIGMGSPLVLLVGWSSGRGRLGL